MAEIKTRTEPHTTTEPCVDLFPILKRSGATDILALALVQTIRAALDPDISTPTFRVADRPRVPSFRTRRTRGGNSSLSLSSSSRLWSTATIISYAGIV